MMGTESRGEAAAPHSPQLPRCSLQEGKRYWLYSPPGMAPEGVLSAQGLLEDKEVSRTGHGVLIWGSQ